MIFDQFVKNTALLKEVTTQLVGYLRFPEIIVLVPRFDFFTPTKLDLNMYFIRPLRSPKLTLSSSGTQMPIISTLNRHKDTALYNLSSQPDVIQIDQGILQSFRDKLLEAGLKTLGLSTSIFQINAQAVSYQIRERIKDNIPFALLSPSLGFYPCGYISSYSPQLTKYLNRLDVSFTFQEIRTFEPLKMGEL